jgi:hypothetical protein
VGLVHKQIAFPAVGVGGFNTLPLGVAFGQRYNMLSKAGRELARAHMVVAVTDEIVPIGERQQEPTRQLARLDRRLRFGGLV